MPCPMGSTSSARTSGGRCGSMAVIRMHGMRLDCSTILPGTLVPPMADCPARSSMVWQAGLPSPLECQARRPSPKPSAAPK
jgi:hypothetical protein